MDLPTIIERKLAGCYGMCWIDGLIEIKSGQDEYDFMGTLFHEVTHHIENELGVDLSEEEVVEIEELLRQIFWSLGYRRTRVVNGVRVILGPTDDLPFIPGDSGRVV